MQIDLLIKNGKVVTPNQVYIADVAIKDGKIICVGDSSVFTEAEKIIDAGGKYLLPGGIDSHTHFETPFQGAVPEETWETGTKAAAIGGTTTIINFSIQKQGKPLLDSVKSDVDRASKMIAVDFALHGCFTDFSDVDAIINEIPELYAYGCPSIKEFLIYRKQGWMIDDWTLFNVLKKNKEYKGFVGIHAESAYIGEGLRDQLTKEGKTEPKYHPISKPNFVEAEAIQRSCAIAEFTGSPMYIVHMSTHEGVDIVGKHRAAGLPIYSETCTHYLTLTDEVHGSPDLGVYSQLSPPLRKQEDIDALWQGIVNGAVSIIGSDHAPFNKASKETGYNIDGFITVPNGAPGVLERMPILFSEGVSKNRISVSRFSEITSTNAAKMFGLYPQKGIIAPGSDADIVIFDPNRKEKLGEHLYEAMDWSLFEGREVVGSPVMTILRGKVIAEDMKYTGAGGDGEFIKGKIDDDVMKSIT